MKDDRLGGVAKEVLEFRLIQPLPTRDPQPLLSSLPSLPLIPFFLAGSSVMLGRNEGTSPATGGLG